MPNKTQKAKEPSTAELQKLVKKYGLTSNGSKKDLALRLWKLRHHMMSSKELKLVQDFLKVPLKKRYKGSRYRTRKNTLVKYRQVPKD